VSFNLSSREETVAALSAEFHANSLYEGWYTRHKEKLGGFPGIWNYVAEAGVIFDKIQSESRFEHHVEWVDSVQSYALILLSNPPLTEAQREEQAVLLCEEILNETLISIAESRMERY